MSRYPLAFRQRVAHAAVAWASGAAVVLSLPSSAASAESDPDASQTADIPADAWPTLQALLERSSYDTTQNPGGTRGAFEQRRSSMLLAEPLVSTGTFAIVEEHARFDTHTPEPSVLLVTPDTVTLLDPETGKLERYDRQPDEAPGEPTQAVEATPDLLGLLLSRDAATLREAFVAQAEPTEDSEAAAFVLIPRSQAPADNLRQATISLGLERGEPRLLHLEQADGDQIEIRLTELEPDPELTADYLRESLPPTAAP